jgi:hypothetical protein
VLLRCFPQPVEKKKVERVEARRRGVKSHRSLVWQRIGPVTTLITTPKLQSPPPPKKKRFYRFCGETGVLACTRRNKRRKEWSPVNDDETSTPHQRQQQNNIRS